MADLPEILTNSLVPIVTSLIFGLVTVGSGAVCASVFFPGKRPPLFESFTLGTLLISFLTFFWASLGLMGPTGRLILLGIFILISVFGWIKLRPCIPFSLEKFKSNPIVVLILIHLFGLIVRLMLEALQPPWAWDECNSHLPVAKAIIETGRLSFHPEMNFNNFPQNAEMLFTWAIAYSPLSTSHLFNLTAFSFLLLGVIRLGRVTFSLVIGLVAAVLVGRSGGLQFGAVHAFVDIWLILYITAAVLTAIEAVSENDHKRLILAGIFIGGAAGVKYTSLIALATLLLALPAIGKWRFEGMKLIPGKYLVWTGILAVLVASPWYIRNIIWFHNPFFPFYADLFPSGGGTYGHLASDLAINHRAMLDEFSLIEYFRKGELWRELIQQRQMWFGIPLGIWFWRKSPFIRVSIVWTILSWFFWLVVVGGLIYYRYYIYLVPVNALVAAYFLSRFYHTIKNQTWKKVTDIIICIILVGFFLLNCYWMGKVFPPLTSDARDYMFRELESSTFELIIEANEVIPDGGNVVGILCEDGRLYADFVLIGGGDYGYANHSVIAEASVSPALLADFLKNKFKAEYFLINNERLADWKKDILHPLITIYYDPDFPNYFQPIGNFRTGTVFRITYPFEESL